MIPDKRNGRDWLNDITRFEVVGVVALVILAITLRVIGLRSMPPGLRYDELLNALNIDGILRNGPVIYIEGNWGHEPLFEHVAAVLWSIFGRSAVVLRMTGVLFGTLGVIASWLLTRRLFGQTIALLNMVALATSFVPLFYGRQGLRAISLPFFTALTVYALWMAIRPDSQDHQPPKWSTYLFYALGGVALGCALLTYPSSRVLPVALITFIIYLALFHRATLKGQWLGLLLYVALAAVIAGPMFYYLRTHPAAEERMWQLQSVLTPLSQGDPSLLIDSLRKTVLMFIWDGDRHWLYNFSRRPFFPWPVAILFFIGVITAVVRWKQPRYFLILALFGSALVPSILASNDPSFIRSINIIPVVYLFPMIGFLLLQDWVIKRVPAQRSVFPLLIVVLVSAYSANEVYAYFGQWVPHPEAQKEFSVANEELVRALERHPDQNDVVVSAPGGAYHDPWDRIQVDLLLHEEIDVRWFNGTSSLIIPQSETAIPYFFRENTPLDPVWALSLSESEEYGVTHYAEYTLQNPAAAVAHTKAALQQSPNIQFDDVVTLVGIQNLREQYAPAEALVFQSFWEVNHPLSEPYIVFVHMLSESGEWVAGWDRLDIASENWRPNDFMGMKHELFIPAEVASGRYQISVGWYSPVTGARLQSSEGLDHYVIGWVEVQP